MSANYVTLLSLTGRADHYPGRVRYKTFSDKQRAHAHAYDQARRGKLTPIAVVNPAGQVLIDQWHLIHQDPKP